VKFPYAPTDSEFFNGAQLRYQIAIAVATVRRSSSSGPED